MGTKKIVHILAYLYLFIPVCIFLLTWIKPVFSLPIILLSVYCLLKSFQDKNIRLIDLDIYGNKKKMIIIMGILCVWVILSGIGGLTWQNRWDHMFRNAIFNDMFNYQWPVINQEGGQESFLCYYLGYWFPSALVAKLFNSIHTGYFFQFIWGVLGVCLAFLLISEYIKKISYKALIIFIFFSGWDIVLFIYNNFSFKDFFSGILDTQHIETYIGYFNSSSNTTLLFWLYNQIIPFWVGFMLILLQKDNKYLFFIYSLLLLFSPFPLVALIPPIIYLEIKKSGIRWEFKKETFMKIIKTYITIPNITGLLVIAVVALYYKSNLAVNQAMIMAITPKVLMLFVLFLVIEFGVYIICIGKEIRKDYLFHVVMITMILCSFIRFGEERNDFAWRTCIPAAFYLMLIVMQKITDKSRRSDIRYKLLIVVLVIGSFTPVLEISRTLKYTIGFSKYNQPFLSGDIDSVFQEEGLYFENFAGSKDSFFGKYIMR